MADTQDWPTSIREALERLLDTLAQAEKDQIAAMAECELGNLHFGLGTVIRNRFGFWAGNNALLAECQRLCYANRDIPDGKLVIHPDDASGVIIKALWARLRH